MEDDDQPSVKLKQHQNSRATGTVNHIKCKKLNNKFI